MYWFSSHFVTTHAVKAAIALFLPIAVCCLYACNIFSICSSCDEHICSKWDYILIAGIYQCLHSYCLSLIHYVLITGHIQHLHLHVFLSKATYTGERRHSSCVYAWAYIPTAYIPALTEFVGMKRHQLPLMPLLFIAVNSVFSAAANSVMRECIQHAVYGIYALTDTYTKCIKGSIHMGLYWFSSHSQLLPLFYCHTPCFMDEWGCVYLYKLRTTGGVF